MSDWKAPKHDINPDTLADMEMAHPDEGKMEMPKALLTEWLSTRFELPEGATLRQIEATNVWDNRYRIDVWVDQFVEGQYCKNTWIDFSAFVHLVDGQIEDRTIQPKPDMDKKY